MSQRGSRGAEKESYWRGHLERQLKSGISIKGYCRLHELSEGSFYSWRNEIQQRGLGQTSSTDRSRGSGDPGLVAVEIVGDAAGLSRPTLEIECPGGPVVRLREEVSLEVLERVMRVCQRIQTTEELMPKRVRSC